jgi:hypothetical protein
MRVDYTLPALQPAILPDSPSTGEAAPSFRDQLRAPVIQVPVTWEQQLGLDARPFDASYIEPPPRPSTLHVGDAATERAVWRNMLVRHSDPSQPVPGLDGAPSGPVHVMLGMLTEMRQMEDEIVSQDASLTRG